MRYLHDATRSGHVSIRSHRGRLSWAGPRAQLVAVRKDFPGSIDVAASPFHSRQRLHAVHSTVRVVPARTRLAPREDGIDGWLHSNAVKTLYPAGHCPKTCIKSQLEL